MEEEDVQEVRKHFLAVHEKIRKVKDLEGLEKLLSYLQRLSVLSTPEKSIRPTITSNDEALFFFQPTSRSTWIAIEKGDKGFVVRGESDFMAYPSATLGAINSKESRVSTRVELVQDVGMFEKYLLDWNRSFNKTTKPGKIFYKLNPGAKFELFRLSKQPNGRYAVEAEKADRPPRKPARQQHKRRSLSAKKPVYSKS